MLRRRNGAPTRSSHRHRVDPGLRCRRGFAPWRRRRLRAPALVIPVLASCVILAAACAPQGTETDGPADQPTNAQHHLDAPYVVMISFDGFRYDYQDRYATPALDRLAAEGARAERMIPVFPTKTFPNHYSLATGMYPENHGLVGNVFWAPDKNALYTTGNRDVVEDGSWYGGEPIWVTAEEQGMVSASYFWVGSEADVGGVRPSYWHRYDGSVPNEARVEAVLAWLALPAERRPHMITLYFSDTDEVGHRFGPDSPEMEETVAYLDEGLGRLLDGLDALPHGDQVYVVVVSDHGMLLAPAEENDPLDITVFPGVRFITGGPYASVVVDEGDAGRAAQVRDSIRTMLPGGYGVYLRGEVPERFHYRANPRIGDIVIVAPAGRTVVEPDRVQSQDYWTHGWDNALTEMGAVFVARGPGIAPGTTLEAFESIHVYPFLAHVLGLNANPGADGRLDVLSPLLGG